MDLATNMRLGRHSGWSGIAHGLSNECRAAVPAEVDGTASFASLMNLTFGAGLFLLDKLFAKCIANRIVSE